MFYDLSNAFDTVSHPTLLRKLCLLGVPRYLVKAIYHSLLNCKVKIYGSGSEPMFLERGVKQGSPLSPLL